MINYHLPESVTVDGKEYRVRTDYRAILDIILALNDPDLTEYDRAAVALGIFYEDAIPDDLQEAVNRCLWFISGGEEKTNDKPAPKLVDWEKDFRWIAAPINHMLGNDIRAVNMHWWTFLAYYYEIGDCTFAQIVRIRSQQAKGKTLDKADREWLRQNEDLVYIGQKYSQEEEDFFALWGGKGVNSNAE